MIKISNFKVKYSRFIDLMDEVLRSELSDRPELVLSWKRELDNLFNIELIEELSGVSRKFNISSRLNAENIAIMNWAIKEAKWDRLKEVVLEIKNNFDYILDEIEKENSRKHSEQFSQIYNKINRDESVVYHALSLEQFLVSLSEDKLQGYTTQRVWPDGLRRKDDSPDYNLSHTIKGISTTRDLRFAIKWKPIVLVLNLDKIKKIKKVMPYSWNYSIKGEKDRNFKKEREEFIQLGKVDHSFQRKYTDQELMEQINYYQENKGDLVKELGEEEYLETLDLLLKESERFDVAKMKEPLGYIKLSEVLEGIILREYEYLDDINRRGDKFKAVMSHEKYLGLLCEDY